MRVVRRDPAHARADGEGDFDHLVERRLVAGGAQRAVIFVLVHGLERRVGVEHAAAARAEHVPRHFEQAEPGRMQEGAIVFSSSSPRLAAKPSALMRKVPVGAVANHRFQWCIAGLIDRTAERFLEKCSWASLTVTIRLAPKIGKLEALAPGEADPKADYRSLPLPSSAYGSRFRLGRGGR